MDYHFADDLKAIREILGYTQFEMAEQIGVEQVTISRNELRKTNPSNQLKELVYNFAFDKKIQLNKLKEMLWIEKISSNHKLLFHGAKGTIKEPLNVYKGRINNDFGQGFYTGETYAQAISFVFGFEDSSVYYLDFDKQNLKCKEYFVDQEWMMTIAYYRGAFELSIEQTSTSSEIFMRRFMNSKIAKTLDNESILQMNLQPKDIIERVEEEYKKSKYGSVKYTKNEMFWIGYLYRYFSYTYELSSTSVYKIIKPRELRELFLPYHTLSPEQTIERILEAKNLNLNLEEEINRQFEIYKRIRDCHRH